MTRFGDARRVADRHFECAGIRRGQDRGAADHHLQHPVSVAVAGELQKVKFDQR